MAVPADWSTCSHRRPCCLWAASTACMTCSLLHLALAATAGTPATPAAAHCRTSSRARRCARLTRAAAPLCGWLICSQRGFSAVERRQGSSRHIEGGTVITAAMPPHLSPCKQTGAQAPPALSPHIKPCLARLCQDPTRLALESRPPAVRHPGAAGLRACQRPSNCAHGVGVAACKGRRGRGREEDTASQA